MSVFNDDFQYQNDGFFQQKRCELDYIQMCFIRNLICFLDYVFFRIRVFQTEQKKS